MRLSLLKIYLEDMEVISAEETLLQLDITAIGTGNMTEEATEERIRGWTEVVANSQLESAPVQILPPAPGKFFEGTTPDKVGESLEGSGWKKVRNPLLTNAGQQTDPSNPIS